MQHLAKSMAKTNGKTRMRPSLNNISNPKYIPKELRSTFYLKQSY